jgi:hypothetical protein
VKDASQGRQEGATATQRGSERRQKGLYIRARVNLADKQDIDARAERAGMTEGEYIRTCCLEAPKTRAAKRLTVDRVLLAQVAGQLGRVGSNLNQLARVANAQKRITDAAELRSVREQVLAVLDTALVAMGRTPKAGRGEE